MVMLSILSVPLDKRDMQTLTDRHLKGGGSGKWPGARRSQGGEKGQVPAVAWRCLPSLLSSQPLGATAPSFSACSLFSVRATHL